MSYLITAIVPDFEDAFSLFKDLGKKKKIETTTMKERGEHIKVTKKKKIRYVCDSCLENKEEGTLDTTTGRFICTECQKKKK
jgi:formylmethanofuran dehydrogenase subunit E